MFRRLYQALKLGSDPNNPRLNLALVKQTWDITMLYWGRPSAWRSWIALILYCIVEISAAAVSAYVAKVAGDVTNALAGREATHYYQLIFWLALVKHSRDLIAQMLSLPFSIVEIDWRKWLTETFVADYLRNSNYYLMDRDHAIDNPDERIAQDISAMITFPVQVLLGLIKSLSNLAIFGVILYHFNPTLVPLCIVWSAVVTVVGLLTNKPVLVLTYQGAKLAGNFRFGLVHVRTHAECIALHRGEAVEQKELLSRNQAIVDNSLRRLWWTNLIGLVRKIQDFFGEILPLWWMVPLYFSGAVDLGGLTQVRNAWEHVLAGLGYLGQEASTFAAFGASISRLATLREECRAPRSLKHLDEEGSSSLVFSHNPDSLIARAMTLYTPDGSRCLVKDLDLQLQAGESLLITGPTGSGKSSLLRGLAGLWTRGSGRVSLPAQIMFLPQRPYSSLGTLREQITYPLGPSAFDDARLRAVLEQVGLSHLESRFGGWDSKLDWEHVLSPGEQQRLAFARVFLQAPRVVVLDEATSALEVAGEQFLYGELRASGCAYLSVAHRPSVFEYHSRRLNLLGEGQWEITV